MPPSSAQGRWPRSGGASWAAAALVLGEVGACLDKQDASLAGPLVNLQSAIP